MKMNLYKKEQMKTIKELEVELDNIEATKKNEAGRNFLIGKKDALKDVKKLIDEMHGKFNLAVYALRELKSKIEG